MGFDIPKIADKLNKQITSVTGRKMTRYNIPGVSRVMLFLKDPVKLNSFNDEDQEYFKKIITNTTKQNEDTDTNFDIRSKHFGLVRAIFVDEKYPINRIRVKGCNPQDFGGTVPLYQWGMGYADMYSETDKNGNIYSYARKMTDNPSPLGTMKLSKIINEVQKAVYLGPGMTHHFLGYGFYPDLKFRGEPVGFVVYGIESGEDLRLNSYYSSHILQSGITEDDKIIAEKTGWAVRALHEKNCFHKFLNFSNIALEVEKQKIGIVDLGSISELSEGDLLACAARIFLDISNIIEQYYKIIPVPYGKEIKMDILLPYFLQGYFKQNSSPEFLKIIDEAKTEQPDKVFGTYPKASYSAEEQKFIAYGGTETLIHPYLITLCFPGEELSLEDYALDSEMFRPFWESIKSVADSITKFYF